MSTGQLGEDMAAGIYRKAGWTVLARNFKCLAGEIDIIVRGFDGILVFIEVKSMHSGSLSPEHHLTKTKIKRVERAAQVFIAKHPRAVSAAGFRIDAMAILLTKDNKISEIRKYENISSR